jgi:hypothetical protein
MFFLRKMSGPLLAACMNNGCLPVDKTTGAFMSQTAYIRVFTIVVIGFFLAGCAKPIPYRNVNFQDGVYDAEILSIAAHELEISPDKDKFSLKGSFVRNRFTRCLENHKLVVFPSRKFFSNWQYFVVVDKRTGVVAKSGRMSPQRNSWAVMVRGIDGCYE